MSYQEQIQADYDRLSASGDQNALNQYLATTEFTPQQIAEVTGFTVDNLTSAIGSAQQSYTGSPSGGGGGSYAPSTVQTGEDFNQYTGSDSISLDSNSFDEQAYLEANPDVAAAVQRGELGSGLDHWNQWGKTEGRTLGASPYQTGIGALGAPALGAATPSGFDLTKYLTPEGPLTGASFTSVINDVLKNPDATPDQIDQVLALYANDPAFQEKFGDNFGKLQSDWTTAKERWSTGDAHWTEAAKNPFVANNLFNEVGKAQQQTAQALGKNYWTGEGFGSKELNTQAFVGDLMRQGVTSLNDLTTTEVPIIRPNTSVQRGDDGNWYTYREEGGGDGSERAVQGPAITDPAVIQQLEAQRQEQQRLYPDEPSRYDQARIDFDTGRTETQLVNTRTGERVGQDYFSDQVARNAGADPLQYMPEANAPIKVGETYEGKGATDFLLVPAQKVDPETGEVRTQLIPATQYRNTNDGKAIASGVLSIGSLVPGVAPFAMAANAGLKASQGDYLGAVLSGIAATPGIANAFGAPLAADTAGTLKTVGGGLNVANSIAKGDYLGAITGAGNMVGAGGWKIPGTEGFQEGGVGLGQVAKGIGSLNAIRQGDVLGGIGGLADATGYDKTKLGDSGVNVGQLLQGAGAAQDIASGNIFKGIAGGLDLAGVSKEKIGGTNITAGGALGFLNNIDKLTNAGQGPQVPLAAINAAVNRPSSTGTPVAQASPAGATPAAATPAALQTGSGAITAASEARQAPTNDAPPTSAEPKNVDNSDYLNWYDDIKQAYEEQSRKPGAKTADEFADWHWQNYGQKEGRYGYNPIDPKAAPGPNEAANNPGVNSYVRNNPDLAKNYNGAGYGDKGYTFEEYAVLDWLSKGAPEGQGISLQKNGTYGFDTPKEEVFKSQFTPDQQKSIAQYYVNATRGPEAAYGGARAVLGGMAEYGVSRQELQNAVAKYGLESIPEHSRPGGSYYGGFASKHIDDLIDTTAKAVGLQEGFGGPRATETKVHRELTPQEREMLEFSQLMDEQGAYGQNRGNVPGAIYSDVVNGRGTGGYVTEGDLARAREFIEGHAYYFGPNGWSDARTNANWRQELAQYSASEKAYWARLIRQNEGKISPFVSGPQSGKNAPGGKLEDLAPGLMANGIRPGMAIPGASGVTATPGAVIPYLQQVAKSQGSGIASLPANTQRTVSTGGGGGGGYTASSGTPRYVSDNMLSQAQLLQIAKSGGSDTTTSNEVVGGKAVDGKIPASKSSSKSTTKSSSAKKK